MLNIIFCKDKKLSKKDLIKLTAYAVIGSDCYDSKIDINSDFISREQFEKILTNLSNKGIEYSLIKFENVPICVSYYY